MKRFYAIDTRDWTWSWVSPERFDELVEESTGHFILNEVPENVDFREMMTKMPKVIETFKKFEAEAARAEEFFNCPGCEPEELIWDETQKIRVCPNCGCPEEYI